MNVKKHRSGLRKMFGLIEDYDLIDFPRKISGTKISRALYGDHMGCSWCFPHGWDLINSKESKRQRSWKRFRKTQWK